MKADFTPTGGSIAHLGDDSSKWSVVLEQLGGAGLEQVDQLAFASAVSRIMRGNLAGDCVFTAAKSHASLDAAATFFATEYGRIGQRGALVLTFASHALTMALATVKAVHRVEAEDGRGVRWKIRYTFGITTITYA